MNVDPSILVTLLNPLGADGYLSRKRDPVDRRRHDVTLTPAGDKRRRITTSACAMRSRQRTQ